MDEVLFTEGLGGGLLSEFFPFITVFLEMSLAYHREKTSSDVLIYIHLDYTDLWVDVLGSTNLFWGLWQI